MMLDGELTTLALCWRLERRDGVTVGLTAHDRDLLVGGLVYRAAPGMTPSAVKRSAALDADTMDVTGALTAELQGASVRLERPVVEVTSPECRAELGDARCRVALAGRRRFARVAAVADAVLTLDAAEPTPNAYGGGRLRWFGGGNSGLEDAIAASDGAQVTLRRPPRFDGAGALVEIVEGCDKSLATCAARFGNVANFRGEPYLPGIDLLTRYPGE